MRVTFNRKMMGRKMTDQAPMARYPEDLNQDLADILGRPCFTAIHICELFRRSGTVIEERAEAEQAFMIHWLLKLYLRHGEGWRDVAQNQMRAMIKALGSTEQQGAEK